MCSVVVGATVHLAERATEDLLQYEATLHLDLDFDVFSNFGKTQKYQIFL